MPTGPRHPDGGYALTPDPDDTPDRTTTGDATTAHHEELLRTEALAARRGNRAVAKFAVVGLVAALAVGVVTWRNTLPGDKGVDRPVADAASDADLVQGSGVPTVTQPPRDRTERPPSPDQGAVVARPEPTNVTGGLVPLHEDPYLPPNAWNGGETLAPSTTGQDTTPREESGDRSPGNSTDRWPSFGDLRPSLPPLPSLPSDLPDLPGIGDGSDIPGTGTTTDDPGDGDDGDDGDRPTTDPEEPQEPTEPTEPTDPEDSTTPPTQPVPPDEPGSGSASETPDADVTEPAEGVGAPGGPTDATGADQVGPDTPGDGTGTTDTTG